MNRHSQTAPGYHASVRILIVAGAHVVALWVIADALNVRLPVELFRGSQLVTVDAPVRPVVPVEPPIPNGLDPQPTTPTIPSPLLPLVSEPPDRTDTPAVFSGDDAGEGAAAAATPVWIEARLDPQHPLSQPAYPVPSVRLEEQGVVELELRVAPNGRVVAALVLRSSGYPRLDAAAVAEALRSWRLLPATRDGAPVESNRRQRVAFRLEEH